MNSKNNTSPSVQPPAGSPSKHSKKRLLSIIAILVLAAAVAAFIISRNNKPSATANITQSPPKPNNTFCIDGTNTIHTPVHDFYGKGNDFPAAFANIFIKDGGTFWSTSDGNVFSPNFHYRPIDNSATKTKHTIASGTCNT